MTSFIQSHLPPPEDPLPVLKKKKSSAYCIAKQREASAEGDVAFPYLVKATPSSSDECYGL